MPTHHAVDEPSQRFSLSLTLPPELRYLADLTAREHHRTLVNFIEWLILEALKVEGSSQLRNADLWHDDPAERLLLLLNRRPDLLSDRDRKLLIRFRGIPELLKKNGSIEPAKLSAKWSHIVGQAEEL